jgi:hypothetical protein
VYPPLFPLGLLFLLNFKYIENPILIIFTHACPGVGGFSAALPETPQIWEHVRAQNLVEFGPAGVSRSVPEGRGPLLETPFRPSSMGVGHINAPLKSEVFLAGPPEIRNRTPQPYSVIHRPQPTILTFSCRCKRSHTTSVR